VLHLCSAAISTVASRVQYASILFYPSRGPQIDSRRRSIRVDGAYEPDLHDGPSGKVVATADATSPLVEPETSLTHCPV
jgi:hypothetical protein